LRVRRGTAPNTLSSASSAGSNVAVAVRRAWTRVRQRLTGIPLTPVRVNADAGRRRQVQSGRVAYHFVEHVGEVELELEAPSEAGIFDAALAAFAELAAADGSGEPAAHEVELAAPDRALLLVDWLNELIYLAEVERFVPEHVASIQIAGGRLHATVAGHRDQPRHLVKGVALNNLELVEERGGWHGRVVLDV